MPNHQKRTNRFGTIRAAVFMAVSSAVVAGLVFLSYSYLPAFTGVSYSQNRGEAAGAAHVAERSEEDEVPEEQQKVEHVAIPEQVKAVYMTACAAATPSYRARLTNLIETTELNSIIIDIKDYSGGISFPVEDPSLKPAQGLNCLVPDMKGFVEELHGKDIFVIGRITVFQDPFYAPRNPDIAVRRESDGGVWEDRKGLHYLDPGSEQAWEYAVTLSKESYDLGFDELNFDYIRFPSDGNMRDIAFPVSGERPKDVVLEEFFSYLNETLDDPSLYEYDHEPPTPVISADLFGMVTTNYDHLGIGQILERALPHFDYIAPMVYPSHYPDHFNGWPNPDDFPYDVIKYSMGRAVARTVATTTPVAFNGAERIGTSTPAIYKKPSYDKDKLRPWLQDFDYGGDYGPAEVRAQIQATYDVGLDSWMLWDPGNHYTRAALKSATTTDR